MGRIEWSIIRPFFSGVKPDGAGSLCVGEHTAGGPIEGVLARMAESAAYESSTNRDLLNAVHRAKALTDCVHDRLKSMRASNFCRAWPESMDCAAR